MNTPPTLVFLHGPPAVGKLTVARELAEMTGLPLFHNHLTVDLLLSVFPFGSPAFVELRERIWCDVFREALSAGQGLIFTFNPEATVRPEFPDRVREIVRAGGARIVFVAMVCDRNRLLERMDTPSRREHGKLVSVDRYRELDAEGAFRFEGALGADVTVDTGDVEPAEAARLVATALSAGTSADGPAHDGAPR